ncbi:MAG: PAS domain-containing protein [Myxococcaceae bacterium]|nr:PAS domain-containing protein [Myxococcaceae bacterium]
MPQGGERGLPVEEVQAFFVEAARVLPESLDEETTLSRLAHLVVEHLADYCIVDVLDEEGRPRHAVTAVSERLPHLRERVKRLSDFAPRLESGSPLARVLTTGEPILAEEMTPEYLDALALSAEHRAILEAIGPRAGAIVPLVARGRMLGAISFGTVQRRYRQQDLDVARAVADRAAVALDNARLYHELRASEARLKAILDHTVSPVFVKDLEGRCLLVNPAFERSAGLRSEDMVGRSDLELFPPAVAEAFRANDAEVMRTGVALQREEVLPQRDGTHTYIAVKFPLPGLDGRSAALCGIATDITGRKHTEEELRRTAEFRERFIGVVSHDLRNPLNAISMTAGLLIRAEETPPGVVRMVRRMASSAERMRRMIEDLLDFTRVRFGAGFPLERRRVDLRDVVRTVVDEAAVSSPDRDLVVTEEGSLSGDWDADRLAQLVGNLVKNALDYSPKDTPVRVSLRGARDSVSLSIHNGGEPIPAWAMPTLYDPFFRATEGQGRSKGGLGLGLYIAQEIVVAHGGDIRVESTAEAGTTFVVELPRRAPAHPPERAVPASP